MSAEAKTIRILTADDHALLRAGIASLVEIEPDMELVARGDGPRDHRRFRRHRRTSHGSANARHGSRRSSPSATNSTPGSSS